MPPELSSSAMLASSPAAPAQEFGVEGTNFLNIISSKQSERENVSLNQEFRFIQRILQARTSGTDHSDPEEILFFCNLSQHRGCKAILPGDSRENWIQ